MTQPTCHVQLVNALHSLTELVEQAKYLTNATAFNILHLLDILYICVKSRSRVKNPEINQTVVKYWHIFRSVSLPHWQCPAPSDSWLVIHVYYQWATPCKKVPYGLSRCHTERRTPTFQKTNAAWRWRKHTCQWHDLLISLQNSNSLMERSIYV